jgi:hypothetical protein
MSAKRRVGSVAIREDLDLVRYNRLFANGVLWIARLGKPSCSKEKL